MKTKVSGSSRKCDSAKYRRQRRKQRKAHKTRVDREHRLEAERYARIRWEQEAHRKLRQAFREQEQALVNVLAARLYQLSPEHVEAARARETMRTLRGIAKIVGAQFM